jgi:hypothetical protein
LAPIPILSGIFVSNVAKLRTSYPRNLIPTPKESGVSKGYLRQADGIERLDSGNGPGVDRGGINWNGVLYRVMGSKLCRVSVNGAINVLGDVGQNSFSCSFAYSFDRLAICSNGNLFYFASNVLTQVTDPNLGVALDVIWVDGYFMTTDGVNIVVTNLADPMVVNPFKYGSAETDPDKIVLLLKLRNAPQVIGRYSIEVQQNVGGNLFPFARIDGATTSRGAIGVKAACIYSIDQADQIAFLGSGKNEPPAIWIANNGVSIKISSAEIDSILKSYPETTLALSVVEARLDENHAFLYVHLIDRTLVYDFNASKISEVPVWFYLDSGLGPQSQYRVRGLVWCYDKWCFGDPTTTYLGTFTDTVSSHYGKEVTWQFYTVILYNDRNNAIIHELELIALTGSVALGDTPLISTSYSNDGLNWSLERAIKAGAIGENQRRLIWLKQGPIRKIRIQKFTGTSKSHIALLALDARVEALDNGE